MNVLTGTPSLDHGTGYVQNYWPTLATPCWK